MFSGVDKDLDLLDVELLVVLFGELFEMFGLELDLVVLRFSTYGVLEVSRVGSIVDLVFLPLFLGVPNIIELQRVEPTES